MAASKRLRVRAVGERGLDPDDDITGPGTGSGTSSTRRSPGAW